MGDIIYTVGHSTHTFDEFAALLRANDVRMLVDVRTVPKSRHTPQFNRETFGPALEQHGIGYRHLADLGGLRHPHKDSANTGWRNASFRGYADHMQTDGFARGIETLTGLATAQPTAVMCAEAVPWRCHRSMIGDALIVRGFEVRDIFDAKHWRTEKLTDFARVDGTTITYPGE